MWPDYLQASSSATGMRDVRGDDLRSRWLLREGDELVGTGGGIAVAGFALDG